MGFWKNLRFLIAIRAEQVFRDYFDFATLLSLLIAGSAGYCFQSKTFFDATGNIDLAKWMAVFACVGMIVLLKGILRLLDCIVEITVWVRRVKIVVGSILFIIALFLDSNTSNTAIENAKVEKLANIVKSSADSTRLFDLQEQKFQHQIDLSYYDSLETQTGLVYKTKKGQIKAKIAKLTDDIEKVRSEFAENARMSNSLLLTTAVQKNTNGVADKTKSNYIGTFLLLLSASLELVWSGHRKAVQTADDLIDQLPFHVAGKPKEQKAKQLLLPDTTMAEAHIDIKLWTCNLEGWKRAIDDIAREKQAGNGIGLLSQAAKKLAINKGTIHRAVDAAMEGKEIPIPSKFVDNPVTK